MRDKVGTGPPNYPCIHISDLEQGRHLRIPGTTIDVNHVSHPPVVGIAVLTDDCHSCLHPQEPFHRQPSAGKDRLLEEGTLSTAT